MNGREIYWPRGRTLGGSSAINGLIYIRGQREDYDHWAALGNPGWGYADVLPYFRKLEHNVRGASEWHGADGPLWASDIGAKHELIEALIAAGGELGIPRNDDFNGATQEGVGYYQLTTRRGLRCSTAVAYLRPARRDANLDVETDAHATRDPVRRPQRARRRLSSGAGATSTVTARREVILARRRAAVAAVAAALRRRARRRCCSDSAFRSSTRCPASARTCRTICRRA